MYSFSPPKRQICAKNTFGEILVKSSSNPVIQETVAPLTDITPTIAPTIALIDTDDLLTNHFLPQPSENPEMPTQYFNGSQLIKLYNVPNIQVSSGKKQVKIVIITPYAYNGEKNASNGYLGWVNYDLEKYWYNYTNFGPASNPPSEYGPGSNPPRVSVHTMPGATYRQDQDYGLFECGCVQMVCTINPNANIWVIEAKSDSLTDILAAVEYANNNLKADVVSLSWGNSNEVKLSTTTNNSYFTNKSICYCATSGELNTPFWPAVSTNCIAVGGTTLLWTPTSKNPNERTEFPWVYAGVGYSKTFIKPSYQSGDDMYKLKINTNSKRCIPDVSLVADNKSMIYIYCSYRNLYKYKHSNFWTLTGTSIATPIFAAIISIADQLRFNKGKSALTSVYSTTPLNPKDSIPSNNLQNYLYKTILTNETKYFADFNDIIIGNNNNDGNIDYNVIDAMIANPKYYAGAGFDVASGIGSPNATALCNDLLNI